MNMFPFSGCSLRILFFGDYELLDKMYGLCGCNGKHFFPSNLQHYKLNLNKIITCIDLSVV